jgi:hypothetical protein
LWLSELSRIYPHFKSGTPFAHTFSERGGPDISSN